MVNYLEPSIIPGMPIERHEHRRLTVILVVLVIIAVIVGVIVYRASNQSELSSQSPGKTISSDRITQISNELKSAQVSTPKQIKDLSTELGASATPSITNKKRAEMAAELKSFVK